MQHSEAQFKVTNCGFQTCSWLGEHALLKRNSPPGSWPSVHSVSSMKCGVFLGCLSLRADQCGCLWKFAAHGDQDPALVLDWLCACSRFSQVNMSERALWDNLCVLCPSVCLSVCLYVWAGSSALGQCIICRSDVWYSQGLRSWRTKCSQPSRQLSVSYCW